MKELVNQSDTGALKIQRTTDGRVSITSQVRNDAGVMVDVVQSVFTVDEAEIIIQHIQLQISDIRKRS